jgi:hypothetical protein
VLHTRLDPTYQCVDLGAAQGVVYGSRGSEMSRRLTRIIISAMSTAATP